MKKIVAGILAAVVAVSPIIAVATPIQGISPTGAYPTIAATEDGYLYVIAAPGSMGATGANQVAANNYLNSILGKMPTLVGGTVPISGNVGISGTPAFTLTGTPTVNINGTVPVSGNVGVTGTVSVSNGITVAETPYAYRNITSNGTTIIKTSAGKLKRIVFNTPGVTSSVTIYDSATASGAKIGTANSALGQLTLNYDLQFQNGLTIVTTGLTPADITVVFQ